MSDTRKWHEGWTVLGEKKRKPMTLRQQVECLEIDMRLKDEAYRAKIAELENTATE